MIRLEHLNLVVKDIEQTLAFYQAAFPHWSIRSQGEQLWYGVKRNWCHFGDDYQYLTFNDDGVEKIRDLTGHQIGLSHFAFVTHSLSALIARLAKAGYQIAKPGQDSAYRKNVYFLDPNGYEVEFVEYGSDIPAQRNRDD